MSYYLPQNYFLYADTAKFKSSELISQEPCDKEVVFSGGFTDEQEIKSRSGSHLSSTHADKRLVLHAVYSKH